MKFLLIISLFCSQFGFAQDFLNYDENYLDKRNSFSLNVFGLTPIVGITYERYLGKRFMIEVGGGYDKPSLEGGIGYKIFSKNAIGSTKDVGRKFKTHFGLRHSYHLFEGVDKVLSHSIVFGATLFSQCNFDFSFDLGPSYIHTIPEVKNYLNVSADPPNLYVNFNIKVGYRFGKSKT